MKMNFAGEYLATDEPFNLIDVFFLYRDGEYSLIRNEEQVTPDFVAQGGDIKFLDSVDTVQKLIEAFNVDADLLTVMNERLLASCGLTQDVTQEDGSVVSVNSNYGVIFFNHLFTQFPQYASVGKPLNDSYFNLLYQTDVQPNDIILKVKAMVSLPDEAPENEDSIAMSFEILDMLFYGIAVEENATYLIKHSDNLEEDFNKLSSQNVGEFNATIMGLLNLFVYMSEQTNE